MLKPTSTDYISILRQLFREYQKACPEPKRRGRPYTYAQETLVSANFLPQGARSIAQKL